ncbi:unnamed protein product [Heterosigma akashiwo]
MYGTDLGRIPVKCIVCDQPTPMKGNIRPVQAPRLIPNMSRPISGHVQNIERDPVVFRGGFRMPGRTNTNSGHLPAAGDA